ncbi:unnamed protein product [Trifolium pratense]|uniref:Uncharacterized protein n=1 Tax=Trifolium pratense TaxID=57577 RepID=A0ACB0J0S6_TRIPR|nr:unnamed protein product [Trifolium pratense]
MDTTIIEGRSISKPPYFDGTNCDEWKERIKIFIQSVDFKLWLVIKNGSKIPKKLINGLELVKSEDEFNDEDMKIMEHEAKAKNILSCALNPDDLKRVSSCQTAKEMWEELDNVVTASNINSTPVLSRVQTSEHKRPNLDFLNETALKGNWPEAKRILEKEEKLKHAAIARGWPTVLHIAAGANHIHFVKELLKILDENAIELKDIKGNTAFCFAAAAGNMEIVELMLKRIPHLAIERGGKGYTPIQFAALQGRCKMTWHLYDKTKHCFKDDDWNLLFFACIYTGIYDLALKMVRERNELAFARDENEETALHLLAKNQTPLDSGCHCPEVNHNPIIINPGMKNHVVFQLVKYLWTTILDKHYGKPELDEIINHPSRLIFDAAEVGNFGFLSELISVYPSLIWDVDSKNRTILHIAVLHRHVSIFHLVHQIGNIKGIIVTYEDGEEGNTLLHMAAKLAPRSQLELVSGAAFQMSVELLWFQKVKKIMLPAQIKARNSKGLTAQELFSNEHEKLRENAESWMKKTAESCMLISTVIATGVFAAAITLPGGNDGTGKPNFLKKASFLVFAISDALAFISSSTAILIFFSILVSRYGEYDFYKSLPLKLIFGLITLFISITSMMVAFSSSFFIIYYHGSKWVPICISILCFLPILLYIGLQFSLFSDIISSAYYWRTLSKPGKNMIYIQKM